VGVIDNHATALERVYRAEGDRLWRAVFAYARDASIADDAVAEAFAQALRRGEQLRDPAKWVWSVSFRIARGQLAERSRSTDPMEDESYELAEPAVDMLAALGRLSPKQRACVVLHHYAGYHVKEIASMIGSTTAAVKVHLSQGRKRLRSVLEEADV
jgi:RNA polymerase sigma-70 factor (ECF subfamily)